MIIYQPDTQAAKQSFVVVGAGNTRHQCNEVLGVTTQREHEDAQRHGCRLER